MNKGKILIERSAVEYTGVEPVTSALRTQRSGHLS
jgi:hypothetical protein